MKTYDILKKICDEHNIVFVDANDYPVQPDFDKKFYPLIAGRNVSIGFVSNKLFKIKRREITEK